MSHPEAKPSVEERVEVEVTIGQTTFAFSFVNTPADCVRDIVTEAVKTALSEEHIAIRREAGTE